MKVNHGKRILPVFRRNTGGPNTRLSKIRVPIIKNNKTDTKNLKKETVSKNEQNKSSITGY